MGPDEQKNLENILSVDTKFLCSHNLMDYSLYLVVEQKKSSGENLKALYRNRSAAFSVSSINTGLAVGGNRNLLGSFKGNEVYHIGLIDYLQKWDSNKKLERLVKTRFLNKDGRWLSAIEPREYQRRFVDQMKKIHESPFD